MSLPIEYRDDSYREGAYSSGKRVHRIQARWGDLRAYGANRTEAKAALIEAIDKQLAHVYTAHYLIVDGVCFVMRYCEGWQYDIVNAKYANERGEHGRGGGTSYGEVSEQEALERMREHFRQYTEQA